MATVATKVGRLKQEQCAIDDRVASMWRRVQETERRPKQMLAFLLKVEGDRDRLHPLVGDSAADNNGLSSAGAGAAEPPPAAEGGEKRARLMLDGDNMVALGPEAVDFPRFYSGGGGLFGDVAVDAAAGSGGGGCSFAFGGGY